MQVLLTLIATLLAAASTNAVQQSYRRSLPHFQQRRPAFEPPNGFQPPPSRRAQPIIPQTNLTEPFKVDGSRIPDVHFDVGESCSGLLPVSDDKDAAELFFWFFPSENPQAEEEILVWFNGEPGCSSLEGILQEMGPFSWQYGTFAPVKNQYSWTNLTNVVWVEFPAGTGFSKQNKSPVVENEEEASANPKDLSYFNAAGSLIFDGVIWYEAVEVQIPAVRYVDKWAALFNLNATFIKDIHSRADCCGYTAVLEEALQFPPKGPFPGTPNFEEDIDACDIYNDIEAAALRVNPCFNIFLVTATCPVLWDVLGYPGTFHYLPDGAELYFDRTDVKAAIHAPISSNWTTCADNILPHDRSLDVPRAVLPRIIAKNRRTILGHGDLDFRILNEGNLIAVQNMTWNGAQGYSVAPEEWRELYVPYHSELGPGNTAGAGILGRWHEERGLTYVTYNLAGHMVPQFAPSSAYRTVEYLLGRIDDLSLVSDFTSQTGDFGNE